MFGTYKVWNNDGHYTDRQCCIIRPYNGGCDHVECASLLHKCVSVTCDM